MLWAHAYKLFDGPSVQPPELSNMLDPSKWEEALSEVKIRKAVPKGEAQMLA